jgi:6,7-dimethyl-8-ribityllumazine synthase
LQDKILIIASRFNDMIVSSLVNGAKHTLQAAGYDESRVNTLWVPGAFEIPALAAKAARSGTYSAIICLGAVIRGETPHFEYVAGPCASGLMNVGIETGLPIIFGVLTTDTIEQALNRSGLKYGNKGAEAASTALSMLEAAATLEAWSK